MSANGRLPNRDHPTQLRGEPVRVGSEFAAAYARGVFWYQFTGPGHRSRIMRCTTESELEWLISRFNGGSSVVIRRIAPA